MRAPAVWSGRERALFVTGVGLAAWWTLVLASDAQAYIDPSAGGMLVQLLLAGTAGVAVLARLFWTRIKRLVGVKDDNPTGNDSSSNPRHTDDGV
jgi:hypothetical protein